MKRITVVALWVGVAGCDYYGHSGYYGGGTCRTLTAATLEIRAIRLSATTASGDHGILTPGQSDPFVFRVDGVATPFTCVPDTRHQTCVYDSAAPIAVGNHTLTVSLPGYDSASDTFAIDAEDCSASTTWQIHDTIVLTQSSADAGAQVDAGAD